MVTRLDPDVLRNLAAQSHYDAECLERVMKSASFPELERFRGEAEAVARGCVYELFRRGNAYRQAYRLAGGLTYFKLLMEQARSTHITEEGSRVLEAALADWETRTIEAAGLEGLPTEDEANENMNPGALRRWAKESRADADALEVAIKKPPFMLGSRRKEASAAAVERCAADLRARADNYETAIPLVEKANDLYFLLRRAQLRYVEIGAHGRRALEVAVEETEAAITDLTDLSPDALRVFWTEPGGDVLGEQQEPVGEPG